MSIIENLAKPFDPSAVSWRVGSTTADKKRGMVLAYVDARDVQKRLDEACGPFGWQSEHVVGPDGKKVSCRIGIKNPETTEWIWKSDGAGETDFEGEKGSYSDSFKRAAVAWQVGRYLYDVAAPWVEIVPHGKSFGIAPHEMEKLRKLLAGEKAPDRISTGPQASATTAVTADMIQEIAVQSSMKALKEWGTTNAKIIQGLPPVEAARVRTEYSKQQHALDAAEKVSA